MKTNKIMSLGLALLINVGIISGCSTTQIPNSTSESQNPNNQTSSTVQAGLNSNTSVDSQVSLNTGSNTVSGSVIALNQNKEPMPTVVEQNTTTTDVQSDLQDDETTTEDSEVVAGVESSFGTKAFGDNLKAKIGLGLGLRPILAKNLGRNKREEIIKDRENVLKAQIKLHEAKLKLLKNYNKTDKLKRKNVDVRDSDIVEIKNDDGTTSKIKTVKFEGKNDKITRENKFIQTFSADSKLIKNEHYLTVTSEKYNRTYTKIINFNLDGSKKVIVKSESKWTDGKSRVVNEERNMDGNGNGTGTGTVVITEKNGTTKAYDINVTITAGKIVIAPIPTSTESPVPTATPTATPTESPVPTATPTATPIVEVSSSNTSI